MKRVALFGGAFDPPTFGHVLAVTSLLNSCVVEEVWLVPTGDRPDKTVQTSASDRLKMLRLVVQAEFENLRVQVVDWQISGELLSSATIDLMEYATAKCADAEFYFVVGADLLPQLSSWKRADELFSRFKFLVLPRRSTVLPSDLPASLLPLIVDESLVTAFSSSLARELIESGKLVSGVVPQVVLEYIKAHGLYRLETKLQQNFRGK